MFPGSFCGRGLGTGYEASYHNTHWMVGGSSVLTLDNYSCFMGDASRWLFMSKKLNLYEQEESNAGKWWFSNNTSCMQLMMALTDIPCTL